MGLEAPAVLVEVGFVSHPEEAKTLSDAEYQAKLAHAITAGVKLFLSQLEARGDRPSEPVQLERK